jgi:hypothetical protein
MTPQARYSSDKHERTVLLFRVSQVRKRGSGGERIIVAPGRRQGPPTKSTGDEFDRARTAVRVRGLIETMDARRLSRSGTGQLTLRDIDLLRKG